MTKKARPKSKKKILRATAFAPATVANVAVGFDILGFALKGLGEHATVEVLPNSNQVIINPTAGFPNIPTDPRKNTATAGLLSLIEDKKLNHGFQVSLQKTIPVGSGLGGSSTSAVATIVAANALLPKKLLQEELLHYAMIGEEVASGSRHADNIGPCLSGGLVLVQAKSQEFYLSKIHTPLDLKVVVILPTVQINTMEARGILAKEVPLKKHVSQSANLAGFILGCEQSNWKLIQNSLSDDLIEPQRAHLIPYFYDFKSMALETGALGFSISGSGPAMFCLCRGSNSAKKVLSALQRLALGLNVEFRGSWISEISKTGARLEKST